MPTRVWTQDQDYVWACVDKERYQEWEDGWRGMGIAGTTEWWWAQLYTDEGESIVLSFSDKMAPINRRSARPQPFISLMYRAANGETKLGTMLAASELWKCATDTMDIEVGNCRFSGDTKTYKVSISGLDGDDLGCEITISNPTPPYRPGTGDVRVGAEEDLFYNITIPVHMGPFKGELSVNGRPKAISGVCHIEHQWMNFHSDKDIAEWTQTHSPWGDYSFHLYDMTFSEQYGYARIPMLSVMHESRGLVFENLEGELEVDVLEMCYDERLGFEIPRRFVYRFSSDTVSGEIEFEAKEILDVISVNELPGGDPLIVRMLEERGEHHRYIRLFVQSRIKVREVGFPAYEAPLRQHAMELQTVSNKFFMAERSSTKPVSVDASLQGTIKGGMA